MIDTGFKGASIVESECYSGGKEIRKPKYVQYLFFKTDWDGITVHTDKYINNKMIDGYGAGFRVAMLGEPKYLINHVHEEIERIHHRFDLILTHDRELLEKFPKNTRFFMPSCPALGYSNIAMHDKNKLVSYMFSNKKYAPGHKERRIIYNALIKEPSIDFVDYYGSGVGPYLPEKGPTINPYMFSLVVENGFIDYNMTEKIFDCFATGTIPIYKGCPSIGDFFDIGGVLIFDTIDELKDILLKLSPAKYNKMLRYAHMNYEKVKHFTDPDDLAFHTIKEFIKETNHEFQI